MQRATTGIVIVALLLVCVAPISQAAPASSVITRYPVPGSPLRVAVEAPGRVWVTLPPQNAIANLVVSPSGTYNVETHVLPTAGSEPYDIAYAGSAVWVTERLGNKIARFDPATDTWTEYPVPTPDSQPTGLVVLPGSPVQIWFAERSGDKLGQLTVAGNLDGVMAEFPLPSGAAFAQAQMEDVAANSANAVWFTLPGVGLIGGFDLSLWGTTQAFSFLNPRNYPWLFPGKTLRPWQMKLDGWGLPWFTEPGTGHLMRYNPNTIAQFEHYPAASTNGELDGLWVSLATDRVTAWYTARTADRAGQFTRVNFANSVRELPVPGTAPSDIAVDADGCAWMAAGGSNEVVRWCPPYFQPIYLPLISRR